MVTMRQPSIRDPIVFFFNTFIIYLLAVLCVLLGLSSLTKVWAWALVVKALYSSTHILCFDVIIYIFLYCVHQQLGASMTAQQWSICLQCRRLEFSSWVGKIPWKSKWQPSLVFLLENPMDRGAWQATVHRITKSRTWLSEQTTTTLTNYCSYSYF